LRITYRPREDATPEAEKAALATVYRLVLDQHARETVATPSSSDEKRKAVPADGPDDAKEIKNARAIKKIIPT
jgi:hypothetical protein